MLERVFFTVTHNLNSVHVNTLSSLHARTVVVPSLLLAVSSIVPHEQNGFDPTQVIKEQKAKKEAQEKEDSQNADPSPTEQRGLLRRTSELFRRVPTLAALFGEVVTFQSLATVLGVCFVRQLKISIPSDVERAAFNGSFYAYVNGVSGLMQFFVLPLARKVLEPRFVYKFMPCLLLPFLAYVNFVPQPLDRALLVTAAAFFSLKTLDYSLRNVVNEMVYQPLGFESRYLGKEVIGVFASRFGKSGMSLLVSLATAQFAVGIDGLSRFSLIVAGLWAGSSWWLSNTAVSNKEAEARVQEQRRQSVADKPTTTKKQQ